MTPPPHTRSTSVELPGLHSLTRHEWTGLSNSHNLADGHARHAQSAQGQRVVERLSTIFQAAEVADQVQTQRAFEASYYTLAGQTSVLNRPAAPQHHYSASVSTEVLANHLREQGARVALLHPTFDNIAAILRRHDIPLRALKESIYDEPTRPLHYDGCDAVFLVVPNNPTGAEPSRQALEAIARECARRGLLLILDFSFRFFSNHLSAWDQYSFFDAIGVDHVGIEDTGKTWPTLDLKIGSLVCSESIHDSLLSITDDCLLNVSAFIFDLVRAYIGVDSHSEARRVAAANRAVLQAALDGCPATMLHTEASMSVAWLRLPEGWRSDLIVPRLAQQGVSVLPGGPFFWNEASEGRPFVRVALLRPHEDFAAGVHALAHALTALWEKS